MYLPNYALLTILLHGSEPLERYLLHQLSTERLNKISLLKPVGQSTNSGHGFSYCLQLEVSFIRTVHSEKLFHTSLEKNWQTTTKMVIYWSNI